MAALRRRLSRGLMFAILSLVAIVMLYPFALMAITWRQCYRQ